MAEFRIYSGNGGYPLSYSNLSPLAPPFNVDRSNPRPPAAQVVAPAENSYNSPLDSTSSNWADSSRKDGYMPLDSMLPSSIYPFHGNDYFSSATVPSLDSIATPSTAPFSYGANMGAKQGEFSQAAVCYPSNLTPVVCNPSPHDATLKEPFHDQKSSLCQRTKFDGSWKGSSWDPFQIGSFSNEMTTAALPVHDDHMSSGGHMLKGLPDEASLGMHMLGKEAQVGIAGLGNGHSDYYLREHPSDVSFVKQPVHGSCSVHLGTSLQPLPPPMKAVKSKGNQATCSSPYQMDATQKHAMIPINTLSAVTSSPACFSRPLVVGASSSRSDAVSFGAVDQVYCATDMGASVTKGSDVKEHFHIPRHGKDDCFNSSLVSMQLQNNDHVSFGAVDHVFCATDMGASVTKGSNVKEHFHLPRHGRDDCFNSSLPSMQPQNNDHVFSKFNAIGNGEPPKSGLSSNDHFGVDCCIQALPFDPRVLSPVFDDYEASMRLEKPLDILDHYTPSVDSPCWKGSSGSHFSPFGTAKVVVRHNEVLEACGSNVLGPQAEICLNAVNIPQAEIGLNAVKISPVDPNNGLGYCANENVRDGSVVSLKKPTVSLQLGESPFHDVTETISCMTKDTCSNDCCKEIEPTEGCELPDKSVNEPNESISKLDLKLCQPTIQSLQDTSLASDSSYQQRTRVADALGANMSFLSTGESTHLHSLGTPTMYHQSCEKTSTTKNHVQTLVGTIYNLSEMLLFYCSMEDDKLEEQDFEALKNVTDNLRKCIPKNYGEDSLLPELQKGTHVDSQQSADSSDQRQSKLSEPCEKVNYSTNHNMESSSSLCIKADADMNRKDEKLIKAIQLALRDKFRDKEEHPQITLYKNLWLEAEAALCASNCTARYNHMKFEVGKHKSESSRDLLKETLGEKIVSSAEPDDKLQPGAKDGSSSAYISIQNAASAVTSMDCGDVMARFHILESRGDGTNYNKARDEDEVPSAGSSQFNGADTPSPTEEKDIPTHDPLIQDSPILNATSKANDIDAAVMDRFHILKNRGEVSSSILFEGKSQLPVSNLEYVSGNKEGSHGEDIIEYDADNAPALQNTAAENCGNKWVWKNVDVNSDPVAQWRRSGSKFGNSLSPSWFDNSSSEWEHVLSEEL